MWILPGSSKLTQKKQICPGWGGGRVPVPKAHCRCGGPRRRPPTTRLHRPGRRPLLPSDGRSLSRILSGHACKGCREKEMDRFRRLGGGSQYVSCETLTEIVTLSCARVFKLPNGATKLLTSSFRRSWICNNLFRAHLFPSSSGQMECSKARGDYAVSDGKKMCENYAENAQNAEIMQRNAVITEA